MKLLAIDYGSKRIGVATSDESRKFALPHSVLAAGADLSDKIVNLAREQGIEEIVIGESRDYKGQPNAIFADAAELAQKLQQSGFIIHLEPEFMTSVQAERFQGKHDKSDASAAALILQSYLDRQERQ